MFQPLVRNVHNRQTTTPIQSLSSNGGEISGIFNHESFPPLSLPALGEGREFLRRADLGLIL
jgi:hypothetical protein